MILNRLPKKNPNMCLKVHRTSGRDNNSLFDKWPFLNCRLRQKCFSHKKSCWYCVEFQSMILIYWKIRISGIEDECAFTLTPTVLLTDRSWPFSTFLVMVTTMSPAFCVSVISSPFKATVHWKDILKIVFKFHIFPPFIPFSLKLNLLQSF